MRIVFNIRYNSKERDFSNNTYQKNIWFEIQIYKYCNVVGHIYDMRFYLEKYSDKAIKEISAIHSTLR